MSLNQIEIVAGLEWTGTSCDLSDNVRSIVTRGLVQINDSSFRPYQSIVKKNMIVK